MIRIYNTPVRLSRRIAIGCGGVPSTVNMAFLDRKSTRLNSSHGYISYAVFCLKKKNQYESDNLISSLGPLSTRTRLRSRFPTTPSLASTSTQPAPLPYTVLQPLMAHTPSQVVP